MISLLFLIERLALIGAGLGGIALLIFLHELGHFLFCKLFNVYTPTFSIGFGPVLWSKKIGTTNFTLSAIPLGGYVEIAGMNGDETSHAAADHEKPFSDKPYYQKLLILLGGILFNILFAFKVAILAYLVGAPGSPILYPETATTTIARVLPDTVAAQQDMRAGDVITAFNDIPLTDRAEPLIMHLKTTESSVTIMFERDGKEYTTEPITVIPGKPFGIVLETKSLAPVLLADAIIRGWQTTMRWLKDTGTGLLHILRKADLSSAGGPVKIISMISQSAADGLLTYLLFLAIISINLALFNLIPVPILDGGQLLLATIETIMQRTLPLKIREYIFIGTWILFLMLILFLSFNDIAHIAGPYFQSVKQCMVLSSGAGE